MPGLNRKGPEGEGPMTGRRLGKCTGNADNPNAEVASEDGYGLGRGLRRGRGSGRGAGQGRGFGRRKGSD